MLEPWVEDGTTLGRDAGPSHPLPTDADWTPYAGPFGLAEAAHLYRRAKFGAKYLEIRNADANGLAWAVTSLTTDEPTPTPPGTWADQPIPDTSGWTQAMFDSLNTLYFTRQELLRNWWMQQLINDDPGMTETMTLFWHDHFATSVEKVFYPQSMYVQNRTLREHAMGNFKDLVMDLSFDPAMLLWLDGQYNYVGDVNENYARELLELFTLGVGHYTQDDVREAARAFTGYVTTDAVNTIFVPGLHDYGQKTFLGQTGNWNGFNIVNIVFQQDETARFVVRKLYKYFLDEYPDEVLVEDLASTFRTSGYEIKPVLQRMFSSQRFFDSNFRGAIYADQLDRGLGLLRSLEITGAGLTDPSGIQYSWVIYYQSITGELLLQPPNVGGWPGYRSWVNSFTLPWKRTFGISLMDGEVLGTDIVMRFQPHAFVLFNVSNPDDPNVIVDEVSTVYYGMTPTPQVRASLMQALLAGGSEQDWEFPSATSNDQIRAFMRLFVRMPDFMLK